MNRPLEYESNFGALEVIVSMPGRNDQQGLRFYADGVPEVTSGLTDVARRDLAVARTLLAEAMRDIDDELNRRAMGDPFGRQMPMPVAVPYRP